LASKQSRVGPLSGNHRDGRLHHQLRWLRTRLAGREVNLRGVLIASAVLLALGFALTFPPIFVVFAPE
jgi:hypothetical protein